MLKYIIALFVAVPVIAIAVVGGAYAYDEVISAEQVSRGVYVVGRDVSGLTSSEVAEVVAAYEAQYTAEPVIVVIDGKTLEVDAAAAGISVDEDAVALQALSLRREKGLRENFVAWFSTWRSTESIEIPITADDEAIRSILEDLSDDAIDTPAVDGSVEIVAGNVEPRYASDGFRLDVDTSIPLVREQVLMIEREPIELPVVVVTPDITTEHVDDAVDWANRLTANDIRLRATTEDGAEIVFTTSDLRSALRSEIVNDPDHPIRVYLDRESLVAIAKGSAEDFNTEPVNARIAFSSSAGNLVVVPSIPGQSLDVQAVADIVPTMAASGLVAKTIPVIDGIEADYTTEDAEALGPFGRVSSFTTRHPCCQSRVTNIQLIARATNGSLVMPGQTFSLNARVGRRTEAKGYKRAGAIIGGKVVCCDSPVNVGGGTSQFATTLWNAVFFGCYQDVFHQPHSLYFSRYPYVREATLGFPSPDVKFRNDSAAPVYIHTSYSSTSITVTLFGNNGGRKCTSSTSGNTVTRTMTWPGGEVTRQHWSWNYRQPAKDEPTTTTAAPVTTTSTHGSPSTTTGAAPTTTPAAPTTTVAAAPTTTAAAPTTTAAAPTTTVAAPSTTAAAPTTTAGGGDG